MRLRLGVRSFGLVLGLIAAAPTWAADPAPDQVKSEIESLLKKLDGITSGLVTWEGSDSFDSGQEGDTAIAVMTNARLAIPGHDQRHDTALVVFDRIEIRRAPAVHGGHRVDMALVFP